MAAGALAPDDADRLAAKKSVPFVARVIARRDRRSRRSHRPVSAFIGRPDAAPGRLVTAWREEGFTMSMTNDLQPRNQRGPARPV
jgi:hypothetical protein